MYHLNLFLYISIQMIHFVQFLMEEIELIYLNSLMLLNEANERNLMRYRLKLLLNEDCQECWIHLHISKRF
jgi:hypothetical protein